MAVEVAHTEDLAPVVHVLVEEVHQEAAESSSSAWVAKWELVFALKIVIPYAVEGAPQVVVALAPELDCG